MKSVLLKFGNWLTRIGEKHGISFLIYNPIIWSFFLVTSRREGKKFAEALRTTFPSIRSAVDVGSGGGGYVAALRKIGIECRGYEYARAGRILGFLQGVRIQKFDCSDDNVVSTAELADIAFSIEVGEHIPGAYADRFVDFICASGKLVVFSAAHPGQGGHGHINEQPKEYWEEKFVQRGYIRDPVAEDLLRVKLIESGYKGWLPTNLQIFSGSPRTAEGCGV